MNIAYYIYANQGLGDPINYATPIAMSTQLTWTSPPLNAPGRFRFGVRASDSTSGLQEQNVDVVVLVVLDPAGNDITKVPRAPVGLRAFARAGGVVRVEWSSPANDLARQPTGFHIYVTAGSVLNYSQPTATVLWSSGRFGSFSVDQGGLTNGLAYSVGVRAFNAVGEEANTVAVAVTADGIPPSLVDSLETVAINQEP
jgi:hypothetical protein